MKAPRKTVKRPIFRYTGNLEKEVKIDIKKEDIKKDITTNAPEKKNEITDTLKTQMVEFGDNESTDILIEPCHDIFDDIDLKFDESFYDINEFNEDCFNFMMPIDFDGII